MPQPICSASSSQNVDVCNPYTSYSYIGSVDGRAMEFVNDREFYEYQEEEI